MSDIRRAREGELENRVKALERLLPTAALDAIYSDQHVWSERFCRTCATVSTLVGQPFGCDRFRIDRAKKHSR